jgi:outer membrane biosynthesis protein TonB
MPRGNDADAASRELAARYRTRGNAEDLVQANMLRRDRTLAKAGLLARDDDATNELELKDVQSEVGDDNVIDFAVRGDYLVTVSEDEDGNVYKSAQPRKETRAAKQEEKESDQPDKDADVQALAERKAAIAKSAREAEQEIEEKVQKAREEAQEEHAKKTQEAADKSAEKSSDKSDEKAADKQQAGRAERK